MQLATWRCPCSLASCIPEVHAAEAEARACVEGLRLPTQWVQGPVILESDCARIVGALQKKEDRLEICFHVVEALEQAQLLSEWRVAQVKRECNSVANHLRSSSFS